MASHGGNTTRRGRFLWLRARYLNRVEIWRRYSWTWQSNPTTPKRVRLNRKWSLARGAKVAVRCKVSLSYNYALLFFDLPPGYWTLTPAAWARPAVVKIVWPFYLARYALGHHHRHAVIGYHRRPVKTAKKRPRDPRNTAFNRRITGCNWHLFRQGYFPDDDVLSRRPNVTDFQNGVPPYPHPWPVPLGYQ